MTYRFLLQLVDAANTDRIMVFPTGEKVEADLIKDVTEAAVKRGVGVFRTEAQVKKAIEDAFIEVITTLRKTSRRFV